MTIRYGNDCTTTWLLEVFTQRNFVADFIRLKLTFIPKKNEQIAFGATLSGLRCNVCTPSVARWKACSRLYVRHNWAFFAVFYGWDLCTRKSVEVGVFWRGGSLCYLCYYYSVVKVSRNAPEHHSRAPKKPKKSVPGPQNVRIFTAMLDSSPFRGPMH